MLTDTEKQNVLFYLGYPGKTITADSTSFNSGVNDRLSNLTAPIAARVRVCLADLDQLDTRMRGAQARLAAKKVDTVETNPEEVAQLKRERRRISKEMGVLLDIAYQGNSNMVCVCV